MSTRIHGPSKATPAAPVLASPQAELQLKCACGATPGPLGVCGACRRKRQLGQSQPSIQRKLAINRPGGRYEQEADRLADIVTRMPKSNQPIQSKPAPSRVLAGVSGTESGIDSLPPSIGRPLPDSISEFLEPRFGHDFSRVRLHTDSAAGQAAAAIGARAFTHRHHVFFGAGQYHPETAQTRRLLAHELTHVIQQEGFYGNGLIQAEFAIEPIRPLHPAFEFGDLLDLVDANLAILSTDQPSDPQEIEDLRDILGIRRQPNIVDEAFVEAVARYQYQFDLPVNGIVDGPTRRQLTREILAEARHLGTLDDETTSAIESNLGGFGLEEDDFGFNERGRFQGMRALNPTTIREIRRDLETEAAQDLIQENLDILGSTEDRFSEVETDLPFIISLGVRESGIGRLLRDSRRLINTAGRDTHPEGRSGMDFFFDKSRAFTSRGERISSVTTGFKPGREDRTPALIENRRLLLAFMVKTAADESTLRRYVEEELENLLGDEGRAATTAQQLFNDLSIDALRAWKALMFAGVGYGQDAVRAVLRGQQAANQSFSLEDILTIESVPPRVDALRLDKARAVALGALVIEGDLE